MFADVLKKLRKEHNLSQEKLASSLGYSRTAISAYELGRNEPSFEDLKKIAAIFNVSVDYLLDNSNSPKTNDPKNKKSISDAEATEILKRKFIKHGIIKEGEDLTDEQLDDYLKKLGTIVNAFKD